HHAALFPLYFRVVSFFFFQAEDGIRDGHVTGVQTCALPIWPHDAAALRARGRLRRHPPRARGLLADDGEEGRRLAWPARAAGVRSEERRVGKECRSRWSPDP